MFQSPSLRGSGRFPSGRFLLPRVSASFQSPSLRGSGRFNGHQPVTGHDGPFQSPSLRGSGRFAQRGPHRDRADCCFNPLHCGAVVASASALASASRRVSSFNPLHCGAVVASGMARRSRRAAPRFNPLHCGAVVASHGRPHPARRAAPVSIPFIAGQWSLPVLGAVLFMLVLLFQSPSLRGSGRFQPVRYPG